MAGKEKLQGTPFVVKTYQLVSDPKHTECITWTDDGESFYVVKPIEFSAEVLPKYFKHNNMCSFIRQLNTYGFIKNEAKQWEFSHESFKKSQPQLLKNISRRKSKKRDSEKDHLDPDQEEEEYVANHNHHIPPAAAVTNGVDMSMKLLAQPQDWASLVKTGHTVIVPLDPKENDNLVYRAQVGDDKRVASGHAALPHPTIPVPQAAALPQPTQYAEYPENNYSYDITHDSSLTSPYSSEMSALSPNSTPTQMGGLDVVVNMLTGEIRKLSEKQTQHQDTIMKILHELMESRREQKALEKKVMSLSSEVTRLSVSHPSQGHKAVPHNGPPEFSSGVDLARYLTESNETPYYYNL